jgi:hypothetical protein
MRCALMLRQTEHYRASVFGEGLRRMGFQVEVQWQRRPHPSDLLVLWNRTRSFEALADIYEAHGARVLIAENGYTRAEDGQKLYALALGHHNGAGRWFVGDEPRHHIPEEPWRESGSHVLVLPQRGIGSRGVAMPYGWGQEIVQKLRLITDRPIVLRKHPGHPKVEHGPSLAADLAGAHCVVTWASGAGIKALQAGIPAFHAMDRWIAAPAARPLVGSVEDCNICDRRLAWTRISWAQWALSEIASGEAFDRLLNVADRDLFRAEQPSLGTGRECDAEGHPGGGSGSPDPPLVALSR